MQLWRFICIWLFSIICIKALAQESPKTQSKVVFVNDSIQLPEAQTILRESIIIYENDRIISNDLYTFDPFHNRIYFKNKFQGQVKVEWQLIETGLLKKPLYLKSRELIHESFIEKKNPFTYDVGSSDINQFENKTLNITGNIGRGITGGNNRNLAVNSNLNLQISGKLADLDVKAAISDENNPIQPEGNTQVIQDFDKVYIQLSKGENEFVLGDYEMKSSSSGYFMKYNKKSRGVMIRTSTNLTSKAKLTTEVQGAISRGRFARNVINAVEGNQGPYKLYGANGEIYIIIISGTEVIYLDGERLKRGEQNDYIIDYNSGELSFTPRRIITRYSRIVAEFQYSDRNYARSVFQLNSHYQTDKFTIHASYFSEQDHKSQPYLQNLSDTDKIVLSLAGDNPNLAVTSGAVRTNTFNSSRILYRYIDSIGFGKIYIYAPNQGSDSVFYDVKFSFVGENKGNYILSASSANGRTYKWVAPSAGIPQGNYEPIIQLITPKRNQLFTLGTEIKTGEFGKLFLEYAHSVNDKNTFSSFDKNDDGGNGIRLQYTIESNLSKVDLNAWKLKSEIKYEQVDKNFRYIERYRDVEFDRTWNRLLTNQSFSDTGYNENIVSFKSTVSSLRNGFIYYQAGYYNRNNLFNGIQHLVGSEFSIEKININSSFEYLNTSNQFANAISNQIRSVKFDISRMFRYFKTGIKYENESSSFNKGNDTLLSGSYHYKLQGIYLINVDSGSLKYKLDYTQREDLLPSSESYKQATIGRNYSASAEHTSANLNRLNASFTYRELSISDTSLINQNAERTLLTRLEYEYSLFKKLISANSYLQIGSGNELKRDFQFLQVIPGQGLYLWKDFNSDGIQSTDEFVLASASDRVRADYIKVFLPTNTSVRVNSNQFSQTISINPINVIKQKNGFPGFITRFNNQLALRLERKTNDLGKFDFLNPFTQISSGSLISNNSIFRNNLFYNRNNPTWGCDYLYLIQSNRALLSYGTDIRGKEEHQFNIRWNLNRTTSVLVTNSSGERYYFSQFYTENSYKYTFIEIKPKLIYQATKQIRVTLIYSEFTGTNLATYGAQKGSSREAGTELRYTFNGNGAFTLKYSSYTIAFDGNISTPLGYDMMQGLTVGRNQLWNINFQQLISNGIQLTFAYDGRLTPGSQMIHIGRMEARYIF